MHSGQTRHIHSQRSNINLKFLDKVTDAGVGELAKHCPDCNVRR